MKQKLYLPLFVILSFLLILSGCSNQSAPSTTKQTRITKTTKKKFESDVPTELVGNYGRYVNAYGDPNSFFTIVVKKNKITINQGEGTILSDITSKEISKNTFMVKATEKFGSKMYLKLKYKTKNGQKYLGLYNADNKDNLQSYKQIKANKSNLKWYKSYSKKQFDTLTSPTKESKDEQNNTSQQSIEHFKNKVYRSSNTSTEFIYISDNSFSLLNVRMNGFEYDVSDIMNPNYSVHNNIITISGNPADENHSFYGENGSTVNLTIVSQNSLKDNKTNITYNLFDGTKDQLIQQINDEHGYPVDFSKNSNSSDTDNSSDDDFSDQDSPDQDPSNNENDDQQYFDNEDSY